MYYAIFHHYHHFYSMALALGNGPNEVSRRHVETEEEARALLETFSSNCAVYRCDKPPSRGAIRRSELEESESYQFICGVVA